MRVSLARQMRIVLAKELTDHLRDRRSLLLSLVYPLLGPLLLGILLAIGGGALRSDGEAPRVVVPVFVVGGAALPVEFMRVLAERRFDLVVTRDDVEQLVERGAERVALIVGDTGVRRQMDIAVVFDPGNVMGAAVAGRLAGILNEHARARGHASLEAAGVDIALAEPIRVQGRPVAAQRDVAGLFYGMIPALLMFMIFLGGTHLAIDATAGERERGSLEPLLTAPIDRAALLSGKAVAALFFTALTVVIHLLGFKLILGFAASGPASYQAPPSWTVFGLLFAVAIPVMLLAVALQFLIATVTRSMKEAQIYLGLLPVIPAMPGMALAFTSPASLQGLSQWPLVGQLVSFSGLVNGAGASSPALVVAGGTTLAIAVIAFLLAVRRFERSQQLSPA